LIVGDNGVIIRYTGSAYEYDFVGDEKRPITLLSVAGAASGERLIAGQGGTLFRFDGTGWKELDSGTSNPITAMRSDGTGRFLLVGHGGSILRRDAR
jgi:hypothetical protein